MNARTTTGLCGRVKKSRRHDARDVHDASSWTVVFFCFFFRTTCDAVWTVFFLGFASLPRLINGSVDVAVCGIETSVLVVWNGVKVGEKLIGRINDIGF